MTPTVLIRWADSQPRKAVEAVDKGGNKSRSDTAPLRADILRIEAADEQPSKPKQSSEKGGTG
jgi:hypothetical protein